MANVLNELEAIEGNVTKISEKIHILKKSPNPNLGAKLNDVKLDLKAAVAALENLEDEIYMGWNE